MCNEAPSLHLRYGLDIALSTLNSCRYLHAPKTRFPVGRLFPLSGTGISPAESAGLNLAHRRISPNPRQLPPDNPPARSAVLVAPRRARSGEGESHS